MCNYSLKLPFANSLQYALSIESPALSLYNGQLSPKTTRVFTDEMDIVT